VTDPQAVELTTERLPRHCSEIYVDGAWIPSASSDSIPVLDPSAEETLTSVPAGSAADVDSAVQAAVRAFPGWAAMSPTERAGYLLRIADRLAARQDELVALFVRDVGSPRTFAQNVQVASPITHLRTTAALADAYPWEEEDGGSLIVRAPVGVVAAITPWNVPLHQIALKVAPALLAGCTVVLKPSEVAPLSAWAFAEVIDEVGLPPGVFNLVSGDGPVVGEALVTHPGVDKISFTGSTRAGRRIASLAGEHVKRLTCELGGKGASVILQGADLDLAVAATVSRCFGNSGQLCASLSRLIVVREHYDEVVERAKALVEAATVGEPSDDPQVGPVVSAAQRERVRGYIEQGVTEGARLLVGGPDAPDRLATGYYVRPTLFADVDRSMAIAREEIFGPVLSILPADDEDDAVAIANDNDYGLATAVWAGDTEQGLRAGRQLRAGIVQVNGGSRHPGLPFGGFKQSGLGREGGRYGLDQYVEIQAVSAPGIAVS
jgi:acyl-CoA reductase-like NAD-dependent aldehyde dehydrogenase